MKRRELTPEERADAERLRAVWGRYRAENKGATQTWLAAEAGLGTQGAVGQYLRGVIPLNLPALLALSRVIEVDPRTISPRLMEAVQHTMGRAPADVGEAQRESARSERGQTSNVGAQEADDFMLGVMDMINTYRLASPAGRRRIDAIVRQVRRELGAVDEVKPGTS